MSDPLPLGAPLPPAWESGTVIGRYTLLTTLATGGMAQIWLARQQGLKGFEKLVVIKRMTNGLENDPDSVQMFLTEARLAAQLTHPHVVQIYELGEQAGSLYIVMEYLDGEDLASVRRTGLKVGLPVLDHYAAKLVAMAAEGLHYAHTQVGLDGRPLRIVHRDVSPQNLIATFTGGLKVVDFGIAKAATDTTNSGKLKGKLAYMSPEQARGEPLDARSDVFSLGIVLFELVTRSRLMPRSSELELLTYMGSGGAIPDPLERRPELDPRLAAIVTKSLQRKRELRYQSARELQDALEGWLAEAGKTVTAGDLADYLRTLFARRIHERRQLIEAATKSELTPQSARQLSEFVHPSSEGSASKTGARPNSRLTRAVVALAIVVVAIGASVVARVMRASEPAVSLEAEASPVMPKAEAQPPPAPPAEPAPPHVVERSVLLIDTQPPMAELEVDGVPWGKAPTAQAIDAGVHVLTATLEGYQRAERKLEIERDGERLRIELALLAVPKVENPLKTTKPVTSRATAMGKLSLRTIPLTEVFLGSRKLGDSPLVGESLPVGRHTLRLVSKDGETSIEVEIKANEVTKKVLRL